MNQAGKQPDQGVAGRSRREIGQLGEDLAVRFVEDAGWTVVARNWRCRYGELDVIAVDGVALVVVEVKARTGALFSDVAEAVSFEKYKRMRRLAALWLQEQDRRWPVVRFDVIAVHLSPAGEPTFSHLRGVF